MGFSENLAYLRESRRLSQQQLDLLIGARRNSTKKWEAGKAMPDSDQLSALCRTFGCDSGALIAGDLTNTAPGPTVPPSVAAGGDRDVFGYDAHMRRYASRCAAGIGIPFAGLAAASLLNALVIGVPGIVILVDVLAFTVGLVAGTIIITPAVMRHQLFERVHPYVEDFYTPEEKAEGARRRTVGIAGGITSVVAGIVACILLLGTPAEGLAVPFLLLLLACGVWAIARAILLARRFDVDAYNDIVLEQVGDGDILRAGLEPARRKERLMSRDRDRARTIDAANKVILVATYAISLLWVFWPRITGTGRALNSDSGLIDLQWLIAFVLCCVVTGVVNRRSRRRQRERRAGQEGDPGQQGR
jgi:DNA-binding XRE family transcriptional regulator